MILVDTSIWIELINGRIRIDPAAYLRLATCGPVIQEVLQGLRPGLSSRRFQDAFMALPRISDPVGVELYLGAAEIYRLGRRQGLTIRSGVDCLIAAIAVANHMPVWHNDRDFDEIARFTGLEVLNPDLSTG
jgi:predicted nucleic acid-binding protein